MIGDSESPVLNDEVSHHSYTHRIHEGAYDFFLLTFGNNFGVFFFAFTGSLAFFVPELTGFRYALRLSLVSALQWVD